MPTLTADTLAAALQRVTDPLFEKDIAQLGYVVASEASGGKAVPVRLLRAGKALTIQVTPERRPKPVETGQNAEARSDLARWGNASLVGLATVADGIYAATGRISDAGTGGVPTLFGTFQYAPLPDALFASGYE